MKKSILTIACAAIVSVASVAIADEVVTTTTTKPVISEGTITEYEPGTSFVVKEKSGPMHYRYGKHVTYVTHEGKTLTDEEVKTRVRVGAPVHVHYSTEGSERIISRVELDR